MKSYLSALVASLAYPLAVKAGELTSRGVRPTTPMPPTMAPMPPTMAPVVVPVGGGGFDDNTQGYCQSKTTGLEGLRRLQVTELLFNTHVDDIDIFVDKYGNFTEYLDEFYQTTLAYLPSDIGPEIPESVSQRDAMLAVMFAQAEGPERVITENCIQALYAAQTQALLNFFTLIGFGDAFMLSTQKMPLLRKDLEERLESYTGEEEPLHEAINIRLAMSHYLGVIESNADDSFHRFMMSFLAFYEAFGEFNIFKDWVAVVGSWEELALTPMSLVGKYAAVYLTAGIGLRVQFESQGFATRLDRLYSAAVTICNSPTDMPSTSPTGGPITRNRFLPVVAVVDKTMTSEETIQQSYDNFRSHYPDRFFCLIQLRGFDADDIFLPVDFVFDEKTQYVKVGVDYGDPFFQSDWYNLCGLKEFETNADVDRVPIYVGVDEDMVEASLKYLERMVTQKIGIAPRALPNDGLDYFLPLSVDF